MDSESPNEPIEESLETTEPIEVAEVVEDAEVVDVAEVVESSNVEEVGRYAESAEATKEFQPMVNHQLPPQFQNVAAKGGAVGALVLGCLAVFGAFVTQWSLFNAVVGLMLGLWGLSSNMSRTAIVGIVLCGIGFMLCVTVPTLF